MNKNSVELIDYLGSDKLHGLAAWASTFLEFGVEPPENPNMRVDQLVDHILNNGKRKRSLEDLVSFLAQNEHTSPFRFSSFIFGMTTDIATHIQKLKHTVVLEAENGESARYKELKEDKFYLPEDWKGIKFSNETYDNMMKFEGIDDTFITNVASWEHALERYTELGNTLYHHAVRDLTPQLGGKRAKETARFFKTYNSQINTLNKFSFDGIIQFANKRATEHAQKEIAEVAKAMIELVRNIPGNPFQYSLKAFNL